MVTARKFIKFFLYMALFSILIAWLIKQTLDDVTNSEGMKHGNREIPIVLVICKGLYEFNCIEYYSSRVVYLELREY